MKQRVTIINSERGTSAMLLLDRRTCRLSVRQARETFMKLAVPGFEKAGELGEWPLVQEPPECDGESYKVVKAGKVEGGLSDLYFLPVAAAAALAVPPKRRVPARAAAPASVPAAQ